MHRILLLPLVVLLATCGPASGLDEEEEPLGSSTAGLGEPTADYPNHGERAFHYLTNRARLAPTDADVCGEGFDVPVTQPLEYNLALNQVARYHSRQMSKSGCFQHESCGFPIGKGLNTCASATSPEQGGSCTSTSETYCSTGSGGDKCPNDSRLGTFHRFGLFGYTGGFKGENIAKGYSDERGAFCAFFLEGPEPAVPDGEEHGHFENMVDADFNEVGHGVVARVYSQDLGGRSGLKRSTIPSASHWRRTAGSTSLVFGAIWNSTAAPQAISVVVAGVCTPLVLEAGTPVLGAYEATLTPGNGCHPYYFVAKLADGSTLTYPDNGSLVAAVGSTCPDYTSDRALSTCGGAACTPGIACTAPDWCRKGTIGCGTGAPVCEYASNVADGTPCGNDQVCISGKCGSCSEGAACDDPGGDPCRKGVLSCASGQPVCGNVQPLPTGGSCGQDKVCSAGACVACKAGDACLENGDPCRAGKTSCATGAQTCASIVVAADATGCGTGMICLGGACASCQDGARCLSADGCKSGTISCTASGAECAGLQDEPEGTECRDGVCERGTCIELRPGADAGVGADAGLLLEDIEPTGCGCGTGGAGSALPGAVALLALLRRHRTRYRKDSGT